jgi:hypothetical protein
MIQLEVGNVLLKPSQRRQLMARLRRSLKLGSRLGNFVLKIMLWRTGRRYELRADVRDTAGDFGCRVRRSDWAQALHDLIQALSNRLHGQCLRSRAA